MNSLSMILRILAVFAAIAATGLFFIGKGKLAEMQAIEPLITEEVMDILKVENAVAARQSFGGTAPTEVRAHIADAKKRFQIG